MAAAASFTSARWPPTGRDQLCAYGASKAGLRNLTRAMAMEWADWKVRVNILSPGPFTSEMLEGAAKLRPGYLDMVAAGTLMKRVADTGRDRGARALPGERRLVLRDSR